MDFKKRIVEELDLTDIQAKTLYHKYIEVCEKLAKEYHNKQLNLPLVVGQSEQYFCSKEHIGQRCNEQCLGCFQFENKD